MKAGVLRRDAGFMLMEAILALAIFSIVITGIVSALNATASLVNTVRSERWIQKQQENVLIEVLKTPMTLEEFQEEKVIPLDSLGAQALVTAIPLQLENQDGDILEGLYQVEVTIEWLEGRTKRQSKLTTQHYYPLYQN
ncbi:type II secretion system protein J [Luteolibacter sp. AS25]|uniref:PulJ/GspJ family protein n=1 Tax=Luteolibacter sp. AS25 TaxID=3135776 RepID=UPI00398B71FD